MNEVLFICTGNYYRSRYAEMLFNHIASEYGLEWASLSRGFQESTRKAPISQHAYNELISKGIVCNQLRYPIKLSPADLAMAHKIILMDEQEHRPMLMEEYSEWSDYVEYWNIRDVEFESPKTALSRLEKNVNLLIGSLETESNQYLWNNNHLKVQYS